VLAERIRTFRPSRLSPDTTWFHNYFHVERFIVALGGKSQSEVSVRAMAFDGGLIWEAPVRDEGPGNGQQLFSLSSGAGPNHDIAVFRYAGFLPDGGAPTFDLGCGPAGRYTIAALANGRCQWARSFLPPSEGPRPYAEVMGFAVARDGVVSWNVSSLQLLNAIDGGTVTTFATSAPLGLAASRGTDAISILAQQTGNVVRVR